MTTDSEMTDQTTEASSKPFAVQSAELVASAMSIKEYPEWDLPEIAMVGRSNVGKSSLINALVGRKKLAYTSNTPGKTRRIHFYRIDTTEGCFCLVDLPGYGYARVSHKEQANWQRQLETFLSKREQLQQVWQLIDSRHGPMENDCDMMAWLTRHNLPVGVVLTKSDKLKQAERQTIIATTVRKFGLEDNPESIVMTNYKGQGSLLLADAIRYTLSEIAEADLARAEDDGDTSETGIAS